MLNTTTRGLGELSVQSIAGIENNKRCKALTAPIKSTEMCSGRHITNRAAANFFKPRLIPKTMTTTGEEEEHIDFSKGVGELVANTEFRDKHKNKGAPLAMIAFANLVAEKIVRQKELFMECFNGNEIVVPNCEHNDPHYHSIIGTKLLHIDWERTHGMQVPCPDGACDGTLKSDRSNFSKNKTLFPVFGLDGSLFGAWSWCWYALVAGVDSTPMRQTS